MRKKELHLYKPIKQLGPPYLTPQQISQFSAEFTLFDKNLSVKKIFEAMVAQNSSKSDKLTLPFMAELKDKDKIGFNAYVDEMVNFFENQNRNEVIHDMLSDPETGEISKETIKEVLEDSLGRQIGQSELKTILEQLKRQEGSVPCLKKKTVDLM